MKNRHIRIAPCTLLLISSGLSSPCLAADRLSGSSRERRAIQDNTVDTSDVELPGAETFLNLAAEEMAKYHRLRKTYPASWHLLNFDYAYSNYHTTDRDIRASAKDKSRWKPRGSHYTYVIVTASRDAFVI